MGVYSNNGHGESRWGCLDFDAHGGDLRGAWGRAFNCFDSLRRWDRVCVILEFSGRGYHVWAVTADFRPVEWWARTLRDLGGKAGVEIGPGVCEISPWSESPNGKAIRAPGTWNPNTGECGEIIFENCGPLLDALEARPAPACRDTSLSCNFGLADLLANAGDIVGGGDGAGSMTRENTVVLSHTQGAHAPTGGNGGASPPAGGSTATGELRDRILRECRIDAPRTRHNVLETLVGKTYNAFGVDVARDMARAQFDAAAVRPQADLAQHLREHESLWRGLREKDAAGLSAREQASLAGLQTEHQRDAFRIVRAFAHRARESSEADFPVAVESLAERLGVSVPGACKIRARLVEVGAIRQTVPCRINRTAARFEWIG